MTPEAALYRRDGVIRAKCSGCNERVCSDHLKQCSSCGAWVCESNDCRPRLECEHSSVAVCCHDCAHKCCRCFERMCGACFGGDRAIYCRECSAQITLNQLGDLAATCDHAGYWILISAAAYLDGHHDDHRSTAAVFFWQKQDVAA